MSHDIEVAKTRFTFHRQESKLKLPKEVAAVIFQQIKCRMIVKIEEDFETQDMIIYWTWPTLEVENMP